MKLLAAMIAVVGMVLGAAQAEAAKRVALVLGNGAYAHAPALPNPRRDAESMAAALERLGFEVELGVDLDLAGMRRVVQDYARKLTGAEVALFFYAGHGMQVHGQNYLLPVDANVTSEVDLDFAAMPARLIVAQMERWAATKVVILDACRDNPFETALSRSMGATRAAKALSRGLAPIEATGGTLLAYATDPGDVAADGEGGNSPFTEALLEHVETPGVEIHTMLARVRADVFKATGQRQRPWTESSLIGEFFMAPAAPEAPPVTTAMLAPPAPPAPLPPSSGLDPREIELAVWNAAQAGGTAQDYREYLRQYPDGIFANLARNRLALLEEETPSGETAGTAETDAGPEPGAEVLSAAPEAPANSPPVARQNRPSQPQPESGAAEAAPEAAESDSSEVEVAFAPDPARLAAAEKKLGLDSAKRREVQARLLLAGHDPRGVDGVFGPSTRAALTAWQSAEGLPATGYLDASALALLERRTEAEYAAWTERRRAEEAARRAAAERARAERQSARAAEPEPVRSRGAPEPAPVEAPVLAAPVPSVSADNPLATPPQGGSPRDRYRKDCYFVFSGSLQLERICE